MGREVRARIEQLREKMAERGMDAYLIPTSDFHGSEYVSGYFKCRKYMTGFTGFGGNGGHYDGGRRSLDGWQIFCAGGSRAFRQRGGTLPLRSGGRADDAGIFEKTYAGTRVSWVLTAEWSIRQRASASRKHCLGKRYAFRRVRIWLEASGTTARRFR